MSINKTEAIILKKQDFRETSIIANFYTRDFGKVSGILKGARSEPKKFASTMEIFSHNEIIFYKKRNSSLHLVSQCDVRDNFSNSRRDILKIGICSLMCELLSAVMAQEDHNAEVFDLVLTSLKELETNNNPEKIMIIFKIKILTLSGFKPHFDSCVSCGSPLNWQSKFSLSLGGLLCQKCFNKDAKSRSIFRGTIATMLHIQKNDFKSNLKLGMNPAIKKELDLILDSFLSYHLEKDFKASRVLSQMNNANLKGA